MILHINVFNGQHMCFFTPKHKDFHMPGFATLRKVQKPMSLQQTEERIKIIKLLSKIYKINFKRKCLKKIKFTHT